MPAIEDQHALTIYKDMKSCEGFLKFIQTFVENTKGLEEFSELLLGDIADMRTRTQKWSGSLEHIAVAYRRQLNDNRKR